MREDRIGRLLNGLQVALGIRGAVGIRRGEGAHLHEDAVLVGDGLIGEHLVDVHDRLGDRAQPRELGVVQEDLQQFGRRDAPVHAFVPAALPFDQGLMQAP